MRPLHLMRNGTLPINDSGIRVLTTLIEAKKNGVPPLFDLESPFLTLNDSRSYYLKTNYCSMSALDFFSF